MKKLLYVQASPIEKISYSIRCGDAFIEAYKAKNPSDRVEKLNLFDMKLPEFDGDAVSVKYKIMHGKEHSESDVKVWDEVKSIISRFAGADKYVFTIPMWNFSIPYKLKQYIDLLVQPGLSFTYSEDKGYEGLIKDKPLLVIYARGGQYPEGSEYEAMDFQKKYMQHIFGFIGFEEITSIVIEPTLHGGVEVAEQKLAKATAKAKQLAGNF